MSKMLPMFSLLNIYDSFLMLYVTAGIEFWGKAVDHLVHPVSVTKKNVFV